MADQGIAHASHPAYIARYILRTEKNNVLHRLRGAGRRILYTLKIVSARYSPHHRAERLIALGRVVLASASLFAVWLDPTQPANYARIAYSLLAAYVAYSVLLATVVARIDVPSGVRRILAHVFDLAFFTSFVYFTAGPSSPFIAYFVFSLVCGTLRWGWKGALWTAAAALTSFMTLGVYFAYVLRDPAFELNPFIIYSVYLGVVAVLLGYLGAHEERSRREMSTLSEWPREEPRELTSLSRELLTHAQKVVESSSAVLAWVGRRDPWLFVASWRHGEFELAKLAPHSLQPIVAADLGGDAFLCMNLKAPHPAVLRRAGGEPTRWRGAPLHPDLVARFDIDAVLAAPLPGETLNGWLFFLDKPAGTADDLELGRIIAGVVASRLDLHYLLRRLQDTAATEERIRLARDLHDGVMQSLTGIALRLAALQGQIVEAPRQVIESIEETRRLIGLEQQDLRFFIEELKPPPPGSGGDRQGLGERLVDLADRVQREWNLQVDLPPVGAWSAVSDAMAREIYLIVREALVNAVRHGGASRVRLTADGAADAQLALQIEDNGRGFPFQGSFSQADLDREALGPKSICERVASLRGVLTLQSAPSGARLTVLLPLQVGRS